MSSSDDTDSDSSVEVSDDSDIVSSEVEYGGDEDMGSNDNDDRLSDTNDRNWVSESVFLEGTESVANDIIILYSLTRRSEKPNALQYYSLLGEVSLLRLPGL